MKKLTFLKTMFLAVVLMVGSLSAFGQTTVAYSFAQSGAVAGSNEAKPGIAVDANIGFGSFKNSGTASPGIYTGQLRLYQYQKEEKGGSIKIYANNGVTITQVIVHASDKTGPAAYTVDGGTEIELAKNDIYTMSDLSATDVVEFYQKDASKDNRIYVDKFEVTYTTSSSTEPTLTATPTSLDFGEVNIGETATQEVTVTGSNLTAAPTHTVSGTGFTVAGELTAEGGTLTVTYAPTAEGASTGTLTITGDEQTATVDLSGTGVTPPLAAPVANNVADTDKTSTSFTASWSAVEGATSYNVYVYTKAGGSDTPDEGGINETFTWTENGTGGNDGEWGGNIARGISGMEDDLPGWTFEKAYKGDNCIKMGSGSAQGVLITPAIGITGDAVLTFRAGAWDGSTEETELVLDITGGGTLDKSSVEMTKGEFSDYTVNIIGATAASQITFKGLEKSNSRFFLDDVKIVAASAPASAPRQKAARPYRVNAPIDNQIAGSPFNTIETSYEVTGLDKSQEYYYSVTAVRDEEESAYSNEIGPISLAVTGLSKATLTDATAWTANGKVMLNATAGEVIEVYNVAGQKVVSRLAADGLNEVAVQLRGVAIVKVGNRISKVVL